MERMYWVKFQNAPPEKFFVKTFEEFWHKLRELMLRNGNLMLEWIILD